MRQILFSLFSALTLAGCNEEKEVTISPPPPRERIAYNLIIPHSSSTTAGNTSTLTINATLCRPLYYDRQLIRVNCHRSGDWVLSDGDWAYKGKDLIFDGMVTAYYRD